LQPGKNKKFLSFGHFTVTMVKGRVKNYPLEKGPENRERKWEKKNGAVISTSKSAWKMTSFFR
jgi:hypothetical protein